MKKLLLLIFLFTSIFKSNAQWISTGGPHAFRGFISGFASNGDTILSCTLEDGLFQSTDSGLTWTELNTNLPHWTRWYSAAFFGGKIFVGTDTNGIIVSSDNGQSWIPANNGLGNPFGISINTFFAKGDTLFMGAANYYTSGGEGIYYTLDTGVTWQIAAFGLDVISFVQIDSILFAGSQGYGVFKSLDGGINWIPTNLNSTEIWSVTNIGNVLLAADYYNGVYVSTDLGNQWFNYNVGLNNLSATSVACYGSIAFVSTHGGGVSASLDSGQTWNNVSNGLPDNFLSLAVYPPYIFAGSSGQGVYRSEDFGSSWDNTGLPAYNIVPTVTSLFCKDSSIYAGGLQSNYFFRSRKGSDHWFPIDDGFNVLNNGVRAITSLDSTLFLATSFGLYKSTNNSNSWIMSVNGIPSTWSYRISSILNYDNKIIAGVNNEGAYISRDSGSTWSAMNNGITGKTVSSFLLNGTVIYATTESLGGFYSTTDTGNHWYPMGLGLPSVYLNTIAKAGNMLLIGSDTGVYISTNYGVNWHIDSSGIGQIKINSLFAYDSLIFAGTEGKGIYYRNTQFPTWHPFNNGIPDTTISSFTTDSTFLYAGSKSTGVWKYPLANIPTAINLINNDAECAISIYPNPNYNGATIHVENVEENSTVLILDLSGKLIANKKIKSNALSLGDLNLNSGEYFIVFKNKSSIQTKKLIIYRE